MSKNWSENKSPQTKVRPVVTPRRLPEGDVTARVERIERIQEQEQNEESRLVSTQN